MTRRLNTDYSMMNPLRSARIFGAVAFLLAAPFNSSARAASTNPLLDFQSDSLTQSFRDSYQDVSAATVNVDVPYGLDEDQKYDVYLPDSRSSAPVIVMVHGGDWTSGDKQDAAVAVSKAGYWVAKGYVFVSINYRLLPKKDPLIQAADVALAIASVQKNAANWSADSSKIVLMGAGAGGHLTALLSSNPSLAADQGAKPWTAAVVLETPALDIPEIMQSSHAAIYDTAFGSNLEYWEDSSPTDLLDSSGLPMLVVCSTESASDSCGKANAFAATADNKGISVTVSPQALSSGDVNAQLGVANTYSDKVDDFINSVL
ncbi:arylformamidase [Rhizobium sp. SG_E_25_P2]|uniref:alpha/beta hydrolase n=1 Tax=Rhizobium sp. SG_E_25_P2 TaxID=2879942 RepID=UPI002476E695|nr:alpha/beta hydrolase [Rhizobium sp. SG_E_25_P2]MDH6268590.1 arylformamidase [Rhizobium sp. SG_E_25_P2]